MNDEPVSFNNEFEAYLGGTPSAEPTMTPLPVPQTGDEGNPVLWIILILAGLLCVVGLAVGWLAGKKRK